MATRPEFLWRPESSWPNAALGNILVEELELKNESHVIKV